VRRRGLRRDGRERRQRRPALVQNSFQGTFSFNYGLFNQAVVGVSLPVVTLAGDPAYQIGPTGATYNSWRLDQQSFSTLALHGKYRLTRVDRGPGIALLAQVGFPLSGAPRELGADPGLWYWPQIVLEQRLGATQWFKIGVQRRLRGHTGKNPSFGDDPNGQPQLKEGHLEYGNTPTLGVGSPCARSTRSTSSRRRTART
jgi:hypothetical protein